MNTILRDDELEPARRLAWQLYDAGVDALIVQDMGLLEPARAGRNRVYSQRDRTRLKLTLRAKRLGLSLTEAKDIIDMYDSPRDTVPQLEKFITVLAEHRKQLENQMREIQANLDEVKQHEKEAKQLLAKHSKKGKA